MSGKAGMRSKKPKTLPAKAKPGWLKAGDGRSLVYRNLHARLAAIGDQFGGLQELSPIQQSFVERFIHAEALVMQFEEKLRSNKPIEIGAYLAVMDRVHGIGKSLGLQRVAKRVDFRTYAGTKQP